MKTKFYALEDNRSLGLNLFEISAVPNVLDFASSKVEGCGRIITEFENIISEMYRLLGGNSCVEILWIAQETQNQTYKSDIRLFFVFRKIGNNNDEIEYIIENTQKSVATTLNSLEYSLKSDENTYEEMIQLISSLGYEKIYSISKSEKCLGNSGSIYPYYYTDIIPTNNIMNFNSLVAMLCNYTNCCVSFQLFPTVLTSDESYYINELSGELSRIVNGTTINGVQYKDVEANEPLLFYSYYNEHRFSPLFQYNILAAGDKPSCASLATKIASLLKGGENKITRIDPICIDISNDRINIGNQFPYYVWNVNASLLYIHKNRIIQNSTPLAVKMFRMQYLVTASEAVSFFKLPLYEKTMPALKCNKTSQGNEQFLADVVNETNIKIGRLVTNDGSLVTIGCPEKAFTKHALIVGTPGSGKTTFSVNLLLQFSRKGIPFLAIEPTKTEYRAMIDVVTGLQIFTPGNNAVSPFIINPFIPPRGIRVEQYIPSLVSAFKAAFSMPTPLDMIFHKAIRSCYIQYGWKDYSVVGDKDVSIFGLYEFITVFKQLMDNTTYSKEVRGNIESAGLLRLTNLIEQNSNIYDSINTIPIEDLLTSPTVLELNAIDNSEQKSLIMALLLINICVYTKNNQKGDGKLKNVILIDEAHVLLNGESKGNRDGEADSTGTTIKSLQDMIAEIRSYGTSIIIADQAPTKVSREVVANTDIKVAFRLVQASEKEMIADSTNMDDIAKTNLSQLHPGEAYVYYNQLMLPQLVRTDDIREKEEIRLSVSDEEIVNKCTYWKTHKELLKPYKECRLCKVCGNVCDFVIRADAEYIANSAFSKYRGQIQTKDEYKKCVYYLPELMRLEIEQMSVSDDERLVICAKIKLIRKIQLELPLKLNENEINQLIS